MNTLLKYTQIGCSSIALVLVLATQALAGGKVLVWGSDAEGGAPYVFSDPDHPERLIGFEVELADALAQEMGRTARQFQTDWTSLIPALKRGDFDIAMNGIEWTPVRAREAALSQPYYIFSQQLVVRADEERIHSFSDLHGMRVATLQGTAAHDMLKATPGVETVIYSGQVEPYKDLKLGRVDAVLLDLPIAAFYAKPDAQLKYAGPPVGEGAYVIALRREDTVLLGEINRALDNLFRSGRLKEIYSHWELWNEKQSGLMRPTVTPEAPSAVVNDRSIFQYLPILLQGAGMTLALSVVSMAMAIVLGLALALARKGGGPILKALTIGYIEIIRGTPLLVQLYIIYYGLPNIGINLSAFTAAVIGLGLNYSAYEAEIYRSGLNSIPKGQKEAALSLGMTQVQVYRRILLPQTVKVVLPPVTNDFISLLKDSSLVSIIAIVELTKSYNMLAVSSMRFLELGLLTAALYLIMSIPLSILSVRLEKRFQTS